VRSAERGERVASSDVAEAAAADEDRAVAIDSNEGAQQVVLRAQALRLRLRVELGERVGVLWRRVTRALAQALAQALASTSALAAAAAADAHRAVAVDAHTVRARGLVPPRWLRRRSSAPFRLHRRRRRRRRRGGGAGEWRRRRGVV
jgi:hypothetical protein